MGQRRSWTMMSRLHQLLGVSSRIYWTVTVVSHLRPPRWCMIVKRFFVVVSRLIMLLVLLIRPKGTGCRSFHFLLLLSDDPRTLLQLLLLLHHNSKTIHWDPLFDVTSIATHCPLRRQQRSNNNKLDVNRLLLTDPMTMWRRRLPWLTVVTLGRLVLSIRRVKLRSCGLLVVAAMVVAPAPFIPISVGVMMVESPCRIRRVCIMTVGVAL